MSEQKPEPFSGCSLVEWDGAGDAFHVDNLNEDHVQAFVAPVNILVAGHDLNASKNYPTHIHQDDDFRVNQDLPDDNVNRATALEIINREFGLLWESSPVDLPTTVWHSAVARAYTAALEEADEHAAARLENAELSFVSGLRESWVPEALVGGTDGPAIPTSPPVVSAFNAVMPAVLEHGTTRFRRRGSSFAFKSTASSAPGAHIWRTENSDVPEIPLVTTASDRLLQGDEAARLGNGGSSSAFRPSNAGAHGGHSAMEAIVAIDFDALVPAVDQHASGATRPRNDESDFTFRLSSSPAPVGREAISDFPAIPPVADGGDLLSPFIGVSFDRAVGEQPEAPPMAMPVHARQTRVAETTLQLLRSLLSETLQSQGSGGIVPLRAMDSDGPSVQPAGPLDLPTSPHALPTFPFSSIAPEERAYRCLFHGCAHGVVGSGAEVMAHIKAVHLAERDPVSGRAIPWSRRMHTTVVCGWPSCGKAMYVQSLQKHIESIHLGMGVTCAECGRYLKRRDELQRHRKTCKRQERGSMGRGRS